MYYSHDKVHNTPEKSVFKVTHKLDVSKPQCVVCTVLYIVDNIVYRIVIITLFTLDTDISYLLACKTVVIKSYSAD